MVCNQVVFPVNKMNVVEFISKREREKKKEIQALYGGHVTHTQTNAHIIHIFIV